MNATQELGPRPVIDLLPRRTDPILVGIYAENFLISLTPQEQLLLEILGSQGLSTGEAIASLYPQDQNTPRKKLRNRLSVRLSTLRKRPESPLIISVINGNEAEEARYYIDNGTVEDNKVLSLFEKARQTGRNCFMEDVKKSPLTKTRRGRKGDMVPTLVSTLGLPQLNEKEKQRIRQDALGLMPTTRSVIEPLLCNPNSFLPIVEWLTQINRGRTKATQIGEKNIPSINEDLKGLAGGSNIRIQVVKKPEETYVLLESPAF